jgi:hypothetical protein
MEDQTILTQALPENFPFYHLGTVEAQKAEGSDVEWTFDADQTAVSYRFHGDSEGMLVVVFDQGLDESTYLEMGNVIAAKLATNLSKAQGWDVMISPPEKLKSAQLQALLPRVPQKIIRNYLHLHQGRSILVSTLLFQMSGVAGNV